MAIREPYRATIMNVFDAHGASERAPAKVKLIIIHCERMNTTASSSSSSTAKQVFFVSKTKAKPLLQTKMKTKRKQFWIKPVLPAAITKHARIGVYEHFHFDEKRTKKKQTDREREREKCSLFKRLWFAMEMCGRNLPEKQNRSAKEDDDQ